MIDLTEPHVTVVGLAELTSELPTGMRADYVPTGRRAIQRLLSGRSAPVAVIVSRDLPDMSADVLANTLRVVVGSHLPVFIVDDSVNETSTIRLAQPNRPSTGAFVHVRDWLRRQFAAAVTVPPALAIAL